MSDVVIQTRDLTKKFGSFTAIDALNLSVQKGETYGFLGPNGAGKTTTLMLLLGLSKPTSGSVLIDGQQITSDSFLLKRKIGVMAEKLSFYEEMSGLEYLLFFGRLYEIENPKKRAQQLMERVNIWQYRNVLVGGYSTGMQRKLSFIRAILHSPEILVLDEPVSGLDPFGIVQIREILIEEHAKGHTVIISSHILSEIERTANRVGIIARGHLVFENSLDQLHLQLDRTQRIEIDLVNLDERILEHIRKLPFVVDLRMGGRLIQVDVQGSGDYRAELGTELMKIGAIVQGMRSMDTSLEQAFITLTEGSIPALTGVSRLPDNARRNE